MTQVRVGWRAYVNPFTPEDPGTPNTIDQDVTNFIFAAGISDSVQTSAIETLVSDLKSYGLWTKMKAIYPFVGGTAASHKWNLKDPRNLDAAYRLVFNGGWVHSSTGALPNGTTGWATTYFNPVTQLTTQSSNHLATYLRTNIDEFTVDMGSFSDPGLGYDIETRISNTLYSFNGIPNVNINFSNTDSRGLFINTRTGNNVHKVLINGVVRGTNANNFLSLPNTNIALATRYNVSTSLPQSYSSKETAFASIGDGLTDTEALNFYISVQKFQTTLGRHVGTPYVSDPDAIAFLMAAGITDGTQAAAINTLVIRMKADGVWTKMKAIYPFVGGSATSHKWNLKDPRDLDAAYRLVFNGGITHTNLGMLPNGTTGYADTKLNPTGTLTLNSAHISAYINDTGTGVLIGTDQTNRFWISPYYGSGPVRSSIFMNESSYNYFNASTNKGLWLGSRINSSTAKLYNNSSVYLNTNFQSVGLENGKIFIAARSTGTSTADLYFNKTISFSSIGDGLTDAEVTTFYNAVQAFQTTLGRQVNVPLVSDTDAQAFLDAANITSFQQASAVNKLVVDLKAAGVWTKMKAIYPFVGGSATSHKWNLKDPRDLDAAYRLVFNGGWTHTGTGAKPNGTTGYADTKLKPNDMAQNSVHMSTYLRTQLDNGVDMGVSTNYYFFISANQGASQPPVGWLNLAFPSYTGLNLPTQAFYLASRTDSTTNKLFRNTSLITNITSTSSPRDTDNIYLGAGNRNNSIWQPSAREQAFSSIGDGLTDAEATAFYTAVQTYQTSLGRHVATPVYNNGLVLSLDAGNANSYPGTGTTWFDLAAGNNGTLTNGPTYDTANGGTILFDGIDDKLSNGTLNITGNSPITLSYFGKMITNQSGDRVMIIYGNDGTENQTLGIYYRQSDNYVRFTAWGLEGVDYATGFLKDFGVWHKWDVVYTGTSVSIYRDGILDPNGPKNRTLNFTANRFQMGYIFGTGLYTNIQVSNVQIYNRALSSTEILNNFNSTRGRFGL